MDLAYLERNTGARLAELVHQAAYRQSPLSRSLYCASHNVSKIVNGMLLDFVSDKNKGFPSIGKVELSRIFVCSHWLLTICPVFYSSRSELGG